MGNLDPLLAGIKRLANQGILLPVPSPPSIVLNAATGLSLVYNPATGQHDLTNTAIPAPVVPGAPFMFPYVDILGTTYLAAATSGGPTFSAQTAGVSFAPLVAGSIIKGMRFVWVQPGSGAVNVTCSLWGNAGKLATVTMLSVPTGIVVATFTSPYTVLVSDLSNAPMVISTYAPGSGGGWWTIADSGDMLYPAIPILASPNFMYRDAVGGAHTQNSTFGLYTTGAESRPTSVFTGYNAMEPTFA